PSCLSPGVHQFTARLADIAGNPASAPSAALAVTVKTSAAVPSVPDLNSAVDSGIDDDNITSKTYLQFGGTCENGTVYVKVDGALAGAGNVTDGNYLVTIANVSPGTHNISAYLLDAAGNTSATSASL